MHRKETFLTPDHPHHSLATEITKEGEEIGLYENTKRIGFKKNWERLIADKGYRLVEGRLIRADKTPAANESTGETIEVKRHRTAINRDKLSAPMQSLARHGYLSGDNTVFDFGCGKGDDLLELEAHGIDAHGWDPVFKNDSKKRKSNIVNLGFVINVIEDRDERVSVLKEAYGLSDKLLVVSVMLGRETMMSQFRPYKDGVITSRDTFQKYYTQMEIREFIELAVGEQAHAVAPGVFFVFKNDLEAQTFLSNRHRVNRQWRQLTTRLPLSSKPKSVDVDKVILDDSELVESFWRSCLDLGRLPANDEFERSDEIRKKLGSHKKAFDLLSSHFDHSEFERAREGRVDDLLVYFALSFFGRRKAYSTMPRGIQRDIKAFFSSVSDAYDVAKKLLFSVGNPDLILTAAIEAHEKIETGLLDGNHSYTVHRSVLSQLPSVIRVYVGCATELYGDMDDVDLVKIHLQSGKVSLMVYDVYGKPLPILERRIKIKMREQDVDWFDYNNVQAQQPLYLKSFYMSKDDEEYSKQQKFDKMIASLPGIDLSDFGPSYEELKSLMKANKQPLEKITG